MNKTLKRYIAVGLAGLVICFAPGQAKAMLATVDTMTPAITADRAQDLSKVQTFLEQKVVRQHLAGMGLTEGQVNERLGNLSDQQLHQVATQIDKQQVAGDGGGAIVTVLLIGILVFLFIYLFKRV